MSQSTAVAERPADQLPADPGESNSIMAIISRAARDPNTDVDKMERLMAMAERAQERDARTAYYAALSRLQDELPEIQERGEIKIGQGSKGQKYALWEDINKAIKPILKSHGFALSFRTGVQDSKITVTGILSHEDGHAEETTIHLPSDTSGSKNAVQAVGSSTSYGKRYTASALLNITTRDGDDDGGAAGGDGPITDDQFQTIQELIERSGADPEKFCQHMKVGAIRDLTCAQYPAAIRALNTKLHKKPVKEKE
jgi:hypothetical protein